MNTDIKPLESERVTLAAPLSFTGITVRVPDRASRSLLLLWRCQSALSLGPCV